MTTLKNSILAVSVLFLTTSGFAAALQHELMLGTSTSTFMFNTAGTYNLGIEGDYGYYLGSGFQGIVSGSLNFVGANGVPNTGFWAALGGLRYNFNQDLANTCYVEASAGAGSYNTLAGVNQSSLSFNSANTVNFIWSAYFGHRFTFLERFNYAPEVGVIQTGTSSYVNMVIKPVQFSVFFN